MRINTTPSSFTDRSYLATKNMLRLSSGDSNRVNFIGKELYFGNGDFTISIIAEADAISGQIVLQIENALGQGLLIGSSINTSRVLRLISSSGNTFYIGANTDLKLGVLQRYTLIKRGAIAELWINLLKVDQVNVGSDLFDFGLIPNFNVGSQGVSNFLSGYVASLAVFNNSMSYQQLTQWHELNFIPESLNANVVFYVPFNQNNGSIAFDVCEQYNYAKKLFIDDSNLSNSDFLITNGTNGFSVTTGTDSDGVYTEFTLTSIDSGLLFWRHINSVSVMPGERFKFKMKIKLIGVSRMFYQGVVSGASSYLDSTVDGNAIIEIEQNEISNAGGDPIFGFVDGGGGYIVGSKFRLYSLFYANTVDAVNGLIDNYNAGQWRNIYNKISPAENILNALRFVKANNHFLTVAGFNPTEEKGYTYIVGFCLESNRNFNQDYILVKRNAGNTIAKLIFANESKVLGWLNYIDPDSSFLGNNNFNNYDTSKPIFYCSTEINDTSKSYPFGHFQAIQAGTIVGFDQAGADLRIGNDVIGSLRGLDGYIFHVSICKGILEQRQIIEIINNTLLEENQPPSGVDWQLYLNFNEIVNDAGTYKIPDFSGLNRSVVLNNYTISEVTPGDPSYRLVPLDSLR